MKYLSWVLYPLVVGYGIYSLIYEPHKSWYSWLLNSLVGAVYTFGFILMCPQACTAPSHITRSFAGKTWHPPMCKPLCCGHDKHMPCDCTMCPVLHRCAIIELMPDS